MKKRRLFQKKGGKHNDGQVPLQITSMADIFMILLVFLLKGIATDTINIAPTNGTKLPIGVNTQMMTEPALQVEISKDAVLIEKDFISRLDNYRIPAGATGPDGLPGFSERLTKEREREKIIAQANDSVKIDSRAIILSDEKVPFSTMKPILRTLAANGYSDVKFAVVKDQ